MCMSQSIIDNSYLHSNARNTTSSGTTTKYTIPDLPDWFRYYLLFFLGIPHLVLSLWMFAEYFMNYKPHFLGWEHYSCLRKYYRWKVQKRVLGRFSFERLVVVFLYYISIVEHDKVNVFHKLCNRILIK